MTKYFRRAVASQMEIYYTRPTQRYIICTSGGYFPVLHQLSDGTLAAIVRGGDLHVGERGWLGITTSKDGGESWSMVRPVASEGPDDRNPAFTQAADGTLILAYVKLDSYVNGEWLRDAPPRKTAKPIYLRHSTDGGDAWTDEQAVLPLPDFIGGSPFGKMIQLPDGTLLMHFYGRIAAEPKQDTSYLWRSQDNGRTWGDVSLIAAGFNETALLNLPSGKIIAMLRNAAAAQDVWQAESTDGGYTWSSPRRITNEQEHPADLIRLQSGRLLLTFGHRVPPYGVRALISHDNGASWDFDHKITLVNECTGRDCGYPSSIQRQDGRIFTAYYAYESIGPFAMWRSELPIGIHAAGVLFSEDDLP
ncbi:MAG: exo-alpha-sialidase [Chloroflexi bacterium]|nr:exo-alpha-sialidase [Chloroflexota bacterium]